MNKKGFTLVELLATVIVLTLVAVVTFPIVVNTIKELRESMNNSQQKIVVEAAHYWANDNLGLLPDETGEVYTLPVYKIQEAGYLNNTTLKDLTNSDQLFFACVEIEKKAKKYTYTFVESCAFDY